MLRRTRQRHQWSPRFRRVSFVVLVAFLPLTIQGCVSIKVRHQGIEALPDAVGEPPLLGADAADAVGIGFLAVRKNKNRGDAAAAVPYVTAALYREDAEGSGLVWREHRGRWSLKGLPPGTYRLEIEKVYDEDGEADEPSGDRSTTFTLRPGEAASVDVVLEKTPLGLIIVLSVTVVLLVALLVILADRGDLDLPKPGHVPVPPPGLLIPPVPVAPDQVIADVIIDLTAPPFGYRHYGEMRTALGRARRDSPILGYSPADGRADVGPTESIDVVFSRAVDPETIDQMHLDVLVDGARVPGTFRLSEGGRHLRFTPLRPLPPGVRVRVRLYGDYIRWADAGARVVGTTYQWSYRVAA